MRRGVGRGRIQGGEIPSGRREEMPLDLRCKIQGCSFSWSHSTSSHFCSSCNWRGGGRSCCPLPYEPTPSRWPSSPPSSPSSPSSPPAQSSHSSASPPSPAFSVPPAPPPPWSSSPPLNSHSLHANPPTAASSTSRSTPSSIPSITSSSSQNTASLWIKCPVCKVEGEADPSCIVFTGGDCVVCMEQGPCVLFPCRHAVVCSECTRKL